MKLSEHQNSELTDICDIADYVTDNRVRKEKEKGEGKRRRGRLQTLREARCGGLLVKIHQLKV